MSKPDGKAIFLLLVIIQVSEIYLKNLICIESILLNSNVLLDVLFIEFPLDNRLSASLCYKLVVVYLYLVNDNARLI